MESLSVAELGTEFELDFALNWGLLPFVRNEPGAAADILSAYVNTYLKEELQAEGLIRNVPPFVRFLAVAGQIHGQIVNALNISREASVARSTVDTSFAILTDTLVGDILPAWRPGLKVREAAQHLRG
jgi:predicted AAA+ superfamily ATPase